MTLGELRSATAASYGMRAVTPLAFVDTETTGLNPDVHEIWEVALILRHDDYEEERSWLLPVTMAGADPKALSIGRFADRHPQGQHWCNRGTSTTGRAEFAHAFAGLTDGAHLVGAVVSFDEERLRRLLLAENVKPSWHYHLVDVEALAAGRLATPPPWNSNELSRAAGVEPPGEEERHTALGDARWAMELYDAVMGQ